MMCLVCFLRTGMFLSFCIFSFNEGERPYDRRCRGIWKDLWPATSSFSTCPLFFFILSEIVEGWYARNSVFHICPVEKVRVVSCGTFHCVSCLSYLSFSTSFHFCPLFVWKSSACDAELRWRSLELTTWLLSRFAFCTWTTTKKNFQPYSCVVEWGFIWVQRVTRYFLFKTWNVC